MSDQRSEFLSAPLQPDITAPSDHADIKKMSQHKGSLVLVEGLLTLFVAACWRNCVSILSPRLFVTVEKKSTQTE